MKIHLPSTFIPDYRYPRKKNYVQSQWRVVLLWYHRFLQSSILRGRHRKLCIISSLKWVIKICSSFYCRVSKIALHSPNPHCCLGKLLICISLCTSHVTMGLEDDYRFRTTTGPPLPVVLQELFELQILAIANTQFGKEMALVMQTTHA